VSFDYDQIELRILAEEANCKGMLEAFAKGDDLHCQTAALIFRIPAGDISGEQRKIGKNVNFAVVYGMGQQTLADKLGASIKEAGSFLDEFFAHYPEIKDLKQSLAREVEKTRLVKNKFGRCRYIPREESYKALNTLIQGTAADLLKMAMLRVGQLLETSSSKILLTIHDELILEVADTEQHLIEEVKALMENNPCRVPIRVSVKIGKNWNQIQPLEEYDANANI
jgi:DNA polymerase-1